ncbi:MAG: NAD-dependent epimerase/dehydratase family protein [Deltaproteobacteria bacterium]|nr:MAG: NAD-dependent epimerase/dehydratase family protein [Deltaproteobacteria bacterium]
MTSDAANPVVVDPRKMGRIFVTGGAGHLGANLVRRLLDEGHEVRALARPGDDNRGLEGLPLEIVEGDVRDLEAMRRLVRGCTHVYHVAAKVSTLSPSAGEYQELFETNVIGTRNVMQAALENGVERVVLSGSFSAVGYDPNDPSKPSNEDMPFWPFGQVLPYARTKAQAEHEALKFVAEGLDVVIATSCAIVGPHDYIPSRLGRTFCDYVNGKLRAYVPGGFPFVAAHDIVEGHLLAMQRGRRGHKYIFATAFQTLDDLLEHFEAAAGLKRPMLKIPSRLMAGVTGVYSGVLSRYFPNVPQRLTPGAIAILRMGRRADTSKAERELGFRPTSIRKAVEDAYEFFTRQGMMRPASTRRAKPRAEAEGT